MQRKMAILNPANVSKNVLLKYWESHAEDVLVWLKGRPVTLEQVFDNKVIYRRYVDKQHKNLIMVNSKQDVLQWAYRHTYSFHPYICSTLQIAPCWYVLDIDTNNVSFVNIKKVTYWLVGILQSKFKYKVKIAFCGKNGFHVFIELADFLQNQQEVFNFSKHLTLKLAKLAYLENIHKKYKLNIALTSVQENELLKLFLIEQKKKGLLPDMFKKTIYFDTRILHRFANIRSPWSIHPETGLISKPVEYKDLLRFSKKSAEIQKNIL